MDNCVVSKTSSLSVVWSSLVPAFATDRILVTAAPAPSPPEWEVDVLEFEPVRRIDVVVLSPSSPVIIDPEGLPSETTEDAAEVAVEGGR